MPWNLISPNRVCVKINLPKFFCNTTLLDLAKIFPGEKFPLYGISTLPHPTNTYTHYAGPYLIACNNDRIFWTVNPDNVYAVEATRDIKQASAFFVFPNEDGGHPYEFVIGYYGDSRKVLKRKASTLASTPWPEMDPTPRYLHAPVGVLGNNFGPLHLKNHVLESQSRLTLHNRLLKHYNPELQNLWISQSWPAIRALTPPKSTTVTVTPPCNSY